MPGLSEPEQTQVESSASRNIPESTKYRYGAFPNTATACFRQNFP